MEFINSILYYELCNTAFYKIQECLDNVDIKVDSNYNCISNDNS